MKEKRKYVRIGVHYIAIHYDTNTVYLCGKDIRKGLELKIVQSKAEVENIDGYYYKKDGVHKEDITEEEFQKVYTEVLQLFNQKGIANKP